MGKGQGVKASAVDRGAERARARRVVGSDLADVAVAGGRGPVVAVPVWERTGGGTRRMAGVGLRVVDVWDRIELAARRRAGDRPFVPPFTSGQVAVARAYAAAVEAHEAGLVKGQRLDASGGGDASAAMDAYCDVGRQVSAWRARIGGGTALALRRVRPSARGAGARPISDRAAVDAMCLGGLTLSEVLRAHGWSVTGLHVEGLRTAISGALDRMQGYRD